jgi:photosystem II stability/assembly factor-like uncharacterized protein
MADASHGWAVGQYGTILYWNGKSWSPQTSGTSRELRCVSGTDPSHVWAAGGDGAFGVVLRFNGSAWQSLVVPGDHKWYGIDVVDKNDIWVAGDNAVIQYNGTKWSLSKENPPDYSYGISALDPNHAWAVGAISNGSGKPTIRTCENGIWTETTIMTGTRPFRGAAAVDTSNVWAVGDNSLIYHWNGTQWTQQTSPVTQNLRGIWALDANNAWAVGEYGVIIRWHSDGTTGEWTPMSSGPLDEVKDISAVDIHHAWAVGPGGILAWNGSDWQQQTYPTSKPLNGISAVSENLAWAVGDNATIVRWDGSTWSQETVTDTITSTVKLNKVVALDQNNVWAVGQYGTILYRHDGSWQKLSVRTDPNYFVGELYDISMRRVSPGSDQFRGWIVGQNGDIIRFDGTDWSHSSGGWYTRGGRVCTIDGTHAWVAAGNTDNSLAFWNGSEWKSVALPNCITVYDVTALDANHVWAVGKARNITQKCNSDAVFFWNGSTWTVDYVNISWDRMRTIALADDDNLWIGGQYGSVMFKGNNISIGAPAPNDILGTGQTYAIEWLAMPVVKKFDVKVSYDNGATWELLANHQPALSKQWTTPVRIANIENCLIRVVGYDADGNKVGVDTAGPFRIEVVGVDSPTDGDVLTAGDQFTVTWHTNATKRDVAKVKLAISKDGGVTWVALSPVTPLVKNPGTATCTVPTYGVNPKTKCKVRVTLKDAAGVNIGSGVSQGHFTINRPSGP